TERIWAPVKFTKNNPAEVWRQFYSLWQWATSLAGASGPTLERAATTLTCTISQRQGLQGGGGRGPRFPAPTPVDPCSLPRGRATMHYQALKSVPLGLTPAGGRGQRPPARQQRPSPVAQGVT